MINKRFNESACTWRFRRLNKCGGLATNIYAELGYSFITCTGISGLPHSLILEFALSSFFVHLLSESCLGVAFREHFAFGALIRRLRRRGRASSETLSQRCLLALTFDSVPHHLALESIVAWLDHDPRSYNILAHQRSRVRQASCTTRGVRRGHSSRHSSLQAANIRVSGRILPYLVRSFLKDAARPIYSF